MFAVAARVGSAPYIICGDFNTDIDKTHILSTAIENGQWHNVADGFPDADMPTYNKDPQWDRSTSGAGSTRIDYIFLRTTQHIRLSLFLL